MTDGVEYLWFPNLDMYVASRDELVAPVIKEAIAESWYEIKEIELVRELVGPLDRVLEIGAGLGVMASCISNTCRPASYLAFEANPEIGILLRKTLERNKCEWVQVEQALLTDDAVQLQRGNLPFFARDEFWVSSTIEDETSREYHIATKGFSETVNRFRPSVLICDIEGGEFELFSKSSPFWSRIPRAIRPRALIIELHPHIIGSAGAENIVKTIEENGYKRYGQQEGEEVISYILS